MLSTIFDVKWHYFIAVSIMKRYCEMCVCVYVCVYFAMSPLEISTEQPILLNIHLNCQHKTLSPANEKKYKKIKWEKKTNKRKRLEIWYFSVVFFRSFFSVLRFALDFFSFLSFLAILEAKVNELKWSEMKWLSKYITFSSFSVIVISTTKYNISTEWLSIYSCYDYIFSFYLFISFITISYRCFHHHHLLETVGWFTSLLKSWVRFMKSERQMMEM